VGGSDTPVLLATGAVEDPNRPNRGEDEDTPPDDEMLGCGVIVYSYQL
jgi:hypothetical protein